MTHPTREQILQAAARLYADHGFRGTTTRAIAEAAGVNEVTLFRIFGSKETLIVEAMREHGATLYVGQLPDQPADPHAELAAWATQTRKVLVSMRSMLRQAMCDGEKSPEMSHCVARGAERVSERAGSNSRDHGMPPLSAHVFPRDAMWRTDLRDADMESALALVHSRFSTNTFPSWERSHPYRFIAHNGEINTLRGNINWMHARQSLFESELFGVGIVS